MTRSPTLALLLLLSSCGSPRPAAPPTASHQATAIETMAARLGSVEAELIDIRRDLHRHPELSGQEARTAGVIAARLRGLGLPVRTGVGGHGVVAIIKGELPGATVAYRADMDAVASDAADPEEFASQNPGVRHICGHDIHVVVGLGVAEALVAIRDRLPGTVVLLFQPAEENAQGAAAMIAAGALADPAPEAIFAVHSAPLPAGSVGSIAGDALAGLSVLELTLSGSGDLDAAAATYAGVIGGVSNVAPGGELPPDPVVAGVFKAERSGTDGPMVLQALVRTFSAEARARAVATLDARLAELSIVDVTASWKVLPDVIPPTVNDRALVEGALPGLRQALGDDRVHVVDAPSPFFSEDFAFFQQKLPGALYWLGVADATRGIVGVPHSPDFRADERAIQTGARAMSAVLYDYLRRRQATP